MPELGDLKEMDVSTEIYSVCTFVWQEKVIEVGYASFKYLFVT